MLIIVTTGKRTMAVTPQSVIGRFWLVGVAAVVLGGCGHEPVRRVPAEPSLRMPPDAPAAAAVMNVGTRAASAALSQLGVPYRYGGSSTRGFDCSGLAQYAYNAAGRKIPRTTKAQWRTLKHVRADSIIAGDLLFFRIGGTISHVGIYLGEGKFVHAPATGRQVSVENLHVPFYRQSFAGAARPASPSG